LKYHNHGKSPYHYSAKAEGIVIEIYPLVKDQPFADKNLRLGFNVDNFDEVIILLKDCIVSSTVQTEWGFISVVKDPDGRKVEIYKN